MRRKSQTDCGFVEEGLVAECGRVEEAIDFVGRDAQTLASAEDDHAVLGWGGVIVEVGEGVVVEQDDGARGGGVVLSVGKGDADRGMVMRSRCVGRGGRGVRSGGVVRGSRGGVGPWTLRSRGGDGCARGVTVWCDGRDALGGIWCGRVGSVTTDFPQAHASSDASHGSIARLRGCVRRAGAGVTRGG